MEVIIILIKELLTNDLVVQFSSDLTDKTMDLIKSLSIIFFSIIIIGTFSFLLLTIFKIAREKDDEEERMKLVKHAIIVVVCLVVEIILISLVISLI